MIDYILDNMVVNNHEIYKLARKQRKNNIAEYTICEEIAYEQRLASEEYRNRVSKDAKTLVEVNDLALLSQLANEMIDSDTLDLDEGGGDVMVVYEALVERPPNLFITERIVVSDDGGVQRACEEHKVKCISSVDYAAILSNSKP